MVKQVFILLLLTVIFFSCNKNKPVIEDLSNENYVLVNQDSNKVQFPKDMKGSIGVVGYIFTNCPDICPLTTNNMRLIQEKLKDEKISNVKFYAISFDPLTDTPSVLKKYIKVRGLDLSNWSFLTGDKAVIEALMKKVGVVAFPNDSTRTKDGREIYFYVHTDRISLFDTEERIIENYPGSEIQINEIVDDIKSLN